MDSVHLTCLIRIYDGMVRKIPLAIGTLTWIMRFDGNDIAFSNVLSNGVFAQSSLQRFNLGE